MLEFCFSALLWLPCMALAKGEKVYFDPQLLMPAAGGTRIDTSRFEYGNGMEAGIHRFDVYVNGQWRGTEQVEFRDVSWASDAIACYDAGLLTRLGIDTAKLAREERAQPLRPGVACGELERFIPGAKLRMEPARQRLYVSVPGYYLKQQAARGYVSPENWDHGITAGRLNYNTNLYTAEYHGHRTTYAYAGLNAGINLGALRLRHHGSATWTEGRGSSYQRGYTHAAFAVPRWNGEVLMGESSTDADLFDAVSFRGVQLASDARMLPVAVREYAPVVRGTADTNARVSIRQRGYLVHETTVAPGPFAIEDLSVANHGGDLEVTVTESDGSSRMFTVPFASTVNLLRPGSVRYSITAGKATTNASQASDQFLLQGTLRRGLSDQVTGYGGFSATGSYRSLLMGAALNTSVGAFAGDVTLSQADLPDDGRHNGSSFRFSYSRNLASSGTNFSLLAYRYSTRGFVGLREAIALKADRDAYAFGNLDRVRSRLDANISQRVGSRGSFYLTGSALRYWGRTDEAMNFSLGYSNTWRSASYSLAVQRSHSLLAGSVWADERRGRGTTVSLNISVPLGSARRRPVQVTTFASTDSRNGARTTASVNGGWGRRSDGSYSVSASHESRTDTRSVNASAGYALPQAWLGAGLAKGQGYRQASFSANGGVLMHRNGVVFAQTLGETVALVEARGADGARIGHARDRLNRRGYGLVASLSPYQLNTVNVDPNGIPDDIELGASSRKVAPMAGAVVRLSFPTQRARQVLVESRRHDGDALPFGAEVIDVASGKVVGAVGQGSRLVVRLPESTGQLRVQWGHAADNQCYVNYQLPARALRTGFGFERLEGACRPQHPAPARALQAPQ